MIAVRSVGAKQLGDAARADESGPEESEGVPLGTWRPCSPFEGKSASGLPVGSGSGVLHRAI